MLIYLLLVSKDKAIVKGVYQYQTTCLDLALEYFLGKCVHYFFLDNTLYRSCSKLRIISTLGQVIYRFIGSLQGDVLTG